MEPGPSDERLVAAAGSARHGRVLVRGQVERLCLAVVDTNGDGALLETVLFHRTSDGTWFEAGSSGAALLTHGWSGGVAYAYGRAPGACEVEVGLGGALHRVPVNDEGWWQFLAPAAEDELVDLGGIPSSVAVPRRPGPGGPPRIAG